uniref:Ragulator complex protein LAMTOR5 n=1 Tax=Vombatus ursinus TaxID=29139 RepID=A0A4X2L1U6_VOMUR
IYSSPCLSPSAPLRPPAITRVLATLSSLPTLGEPDLTDEHAGAISILAQQAAKLASDPTGIPVVCLESDDRSRMIEKHDGITVALVKTQLPRMAGLWAWSIKIAGEKH